MGLRIKKKATKPCATIECTVDGENVSVRPGSFRQSERERFLADSMLWQRDLKAWRARIKDGDDDPGPIPTLSVRDMVPDAIVEVDGLEDDSGNALKWADVPEPDRGVFVDMLSDLQVMEILNASANGKALSAEGKGS